MKANSILVGFVCVLAFLVLFVAWHWVFMAWYPGFIYGWKLYLGVLVLSVLFTVALIGIPAMNSKEAMVRGALVGLVVFGSINAVLLVAQSTISLSLFDTLFGILLGIVLSLMVFHSRL